MVRRSRRLWLLILLGLCFVVALVAAGWLTGELGGPASQPALVDVPLAADKSWGVTADLAALSERDRATALTAMEDAGFRWLRQRFAWDTIEPERGMYEWGLWDALVADTARHNIRVIAVLDGSPDWARAEVDSANRLAPPREVRDFGDWAAAVASRYGTQIDHYQIWDEPNISPHWGAREVEPAGYARLLREGAIRVRAADPGAVILAAALAPNVETGGENMSELLFLEALYSQGSAPWFDVIAAQPYRFGQPLEAPPDPRQLNWKRVALLRDVADRAGDQHTAIWAVSSGLAEATSTSVERAVEQSRRDWPWLGPLLWAAWAPSEAHGDYALMDSDGTARRAYYTLQELALQPPVAWPGVYPPDHESGEYAGDWRITSTGADIGSSGDRLIIPFEGTRLDLRVRRGDYRAFLFVTVDGEPANALPLDGQGRAYIVLYDPLHGQESVTVARGLRGGRHQAEIVAELGWGQWAIAGWGVAWHEGADPRLALGLLALAVLPALGTVVYLGWPLRFRVQRGIRRLLSGYDALPEVSVLILTGGAAALVYVVIGTVPSLAALALLAVLLLLRPGAGLPLIALSLPFYQLGKPLTGKVFSMTEILLLLTTAGWLAGAFLRYLAGTKHRASTGPANAPTSAATRWQLVVCPRLSALDWGVIALVLVGLLSLSWAEHSRVAAREFRTVVLEGAVFYGLMRVLVPSRRKAWQVVDAWVLSGALIAAVGLAQWALGENLIGAEGVWRVRGFYGSPNNLALYLGRILPLTLAVAGWATAALRRRWLYALAALVIAMVLFLTYSRGAWLVGVPASILFLAAARGRRALAVTAAALALVAIVVALVVGVGRLTLLLDATQGTTFFRLQLWRSSWAMVRDHPILGVGLDNFLYFYRSHYVLPTAWEEFNLSHPHNLGLDFWLRLGLPGLLTIAWLIVAFFRRGWHLYRALPESSERLLILGLMGGMVNFVAHGLVDNAFFLVDLAFVFMLMLSLVALPIWRGGSVEPMRDGSALQQS